MLKDLQNEEDESGIPVYLAGISGLKLPMIVKDRLEGEQAVTVDLEIGTNLDTKRGVHMSRFVNIMEEQYGSVLSLKILNELLDDIAKAQEAEVAYTSATFDYFVPKKAPASRIHSKLPVKVRFKCIKTLRPFLSVWTPVMLVCPCSLEISEKGQAHNQRATIAIHVQSSKWVWIEELVDYAELAASSPVWPLLKREDEKYVTDHSHENAAFVEDCARHVARILSDDYPRIEWYRVRVESQESIHAHNAFAAIEGGILL